MMSDSNSLKKIIYFENILEFKKNTNSPLLLSDINNWKLCRFCLDADQNLIDVERTPLVFSNFKIGKVSDILENVATFKMLPEDYGDDAASIPKKICIKCLKKVTKMLEFKVQVERANGVLIKLHEKLSESQASSKEDKETRNEQDTFAMESPVSVTKEIGYEDNDFFEEVYVASSIEVSDNNNGREDEPPKIPKDPRTENNENFLSSDFLMTSTENANHLTYVEALVESKEDECANLVEENMENLHSEMTNLEDSSKPDELQLSGGEFYENCEIESDNNDYIEFVNVLNIEDQQDVDGQRIEFDEILTSNSNIDNTPKPSSLEKTQKNKNLKKPYTPKVHQCAICKKEFTRQIQLAQHTQILHPQERAFKCEICGALFVHFQSLNRHFKIHQPANKKNCCIYCKAVFRRADDMKRHLRTHTGERPFKCDLCEKAFKQSSELLDHKIIHQDRVDFFKCDVCGKTLRSRFGIYLHMRSHGGAQESIGCKICNRNFATHKKYRQHMQTHKNNEGATIEENFIVLETE